MMKRMIGLLGGWRCHGCSVPTEECVLREWNYEKKAIKEEEQTVKVELANEGAVVAMVVVEGKDLGGEDCWIVDGKAGSLTQPLQSHLLGVRTVGKLVQLHNKRGHRSTVD